MASKSPRWSRSCRALLVLVVAACGADAVTAPAITTDDPVTAQFVSSDLVNFRSAYDAGGGTGAYQHYLDQGSPGLKDFIAKRGVTASNIQNVVRAYPRYFASIRATNLQLTSEGSVITRIRTGYAKIKQLYPASVFPPVTFLIGQFTTGGTTSGSGMLVGREFYSLTASSPTDELGQFQKDNVKPLDSLPIIVAHEHVHVLQARAGGMLAHSNK